MMQATPTHVPHVSILRPHTRWWGALRIVDTCPRWPRFTRCCGPVSAGGSRRLKRANRQVARRFRPPFLATFLATMWRDSGSTARRRPRSFRIPIDLRRRASTTFSEQAADAWRSRDQLLGNRPGPGRSSCFTLMPPDPPLAFSAGPAGRGGGPEGRPCRPVLWGVEDRRPVAPAVSHPGRGGHGRAKWQPGPERGCCGRRSGTLDPSRGGQMRPDMRAEYDSPISQGRR